MNVMIKAARRAGRSLKRDLGEIENLQVSLKGPANFVSLADKRAEEMLLTDLTKARPGYGFIGEEGGVRVGDDKTHTWIVDPLDGTTNFLHGIPQFAISIGLQREGTLIAGVIYNPANDELYTAERGKGAFLNDQRLRVAGRRQLGDCVVACGLPHIGRGDHDLSRREMAEIQKGGGPAPVRRRLPRHGLRRRRPPRRLLGTQPAAVGHGGGTDHHPRSRRHRLGHRRRRRSAEDGNVVCGNGAHPRRAGEDS